MEEEYELDIPKNIEEALELVTTRFITAVTEVTSTKKTEFTVDNLVEFQNSIVKALTHDDLPFMQKLIDYTTVHPTPDKGSVDINFPTATYLLENGHIDEEAALYVDCFFVMNGISIEPEDNEEDVVKH